MKLACELKSHSTLGGSPVLEIKDALGARRAHFRGRAHVFEFRMCVPDVRTFFHSILIATY